MRVYLILYLGLGLPGSLMVIKGIYRAVDVPPGLGLGPFL